MRLLTIGCTSVGGKPPDAGSLTKRTWRASCGSMGLESSTSKNIPLKTRWRSFRRDVLRGRRHPFEDQVAILSKARYVASNHGAGLTNMLFMRPGGRVLELRREGDAHNNCFFTLASALKLDY